MMHAVGGGEDYGASGGESQANQALTGDFEIGQAVGADLHDAACPGERGRDVEITARVEGQTLRPAQTLIESADRSVGIDFVHAVGGAGDEQVALRTERQVIRRNADFQRGKDEDLLIASNLEDGAVAVADVEALLTVKRDPGGHAHAFGVGGHGSVGSDAINGAIVARRDIHLSLAIEGDGGGVHHVVNKRLDGVVGIDLKDGDGNLLAAGTRDCGVNVAFGVERGIGYRVKIFGDGDGDLNGVRVANVAVRGNYDGARGSAFGDARD